jgi:signal transduction histidine kinase
MWYRFNLRTRIYVLLSGLIAIALSSGGVMVWYTYRMQELFSDIMSGSMAAYETATSMETALVNQKGFVTYYFLDGDPDWLRQLGQYRQVFRDLMNKAEGLVRNSSERRSLEDIAREYNRYLGLKDQVIDYYKHGERSQGTQLHKTVRQLFSDIIDLCEVYKQKHAEQIQQAQAHAERVAVRLRMITAGTIAVQMLLAIGLGVILIHQILTPVYQMLKNTTRDPQSGRPQNVVAALSHSINNLLVNVDQAQQELEKSRENLQQAEKMALVGKLAAGMAHSIRNPFTSVKMRLFSLGRSLKLDTTQQEDFEVISHEIRHIDTIVQNFLEFSRPPKLAMQPISPSAIVDYALQLLSHRLDSYGVTVEVGRDEPLPEVMADPEQLKEVLVNLIINACEEMKNGGVIIIDEHVQGNGGDEQAVLYISDSGPGVSPAHGTKIFQPFFTTKDEGTGLGLSIASRIVGEHGGTLTLDNDYASGATFVISLPVKESIQ